MVVDLASAHQENRCARYAGGVDNDSLNIIYNIADLVNKTAFGLAIWYAATQDSK